MDFGERLIKVRKEHGYTREALAQSLNISKYTLRNYELGATEPGHTFLKQISDFFHVSIDYLMGLTDEPDILEDFGLNVSERSIVEKYRDLDEHGKTIVKIVLEEEHKRWKKEHNSLEKLPKTTTFQQPILNAAHERTDIEVTEEMRKHDDNIMMDDSEWE